jgi:hypothetical protein
VARGDAERTLVAAHRLISLDAGDLVRCRNAEGSGRRTTPLREKKKAPCKRRPA